jgi:integrase
MEVLYLILLTGQRPGEVMGMMWKELDFGQSLWELPGDRTKNGKAHAVPLNALALEVLRPQRESLDLLQKKRTKRGDPLIESPFVFPNRHLQKQATAPVQMLRKAVKRIIEETGIAPFAPHDLRRTCATWLRRLEIPDHIIDRILNHTPSVETNRVYNRYNYLKEKREALNNWGDTLSRIVHVQKA